MVIQPVPPYSQKHKKKQKIRKYDFVIICDNILFCVIQYQKNLSFENGRCICTLVKHYNSVMSKTRLDFPKTVTFRLTENDRKDLDGFVNKRNTNKSEFLREQLKHLLQVKTSKNENFTINYGV